MNGIYNSNMVRKGLGSKIKEAREKQNKSRQNLADDLNACESRPYEPKRIEGLTVDRLKQWELGNNPVDLEWLPAICVVLGVDYGYLFGEYPEKNRVFSDVSFVTGLSEKAIGTIFALKESNSRDWNLDVLNAFIESPYFLSFLHSMTEYTFEDYKVDVIGKGIQFPSRQIDSREVSALTSQRMLFRVLDDLSIKLNNRFDDRGLYKLLYGLLQEGKIDEAKYNEATGKLGRGDYSDFSIGGQKNG